MSTSIEEELFELQTQLDRLPEADEPPPTTLQILGQNKKEQTWQELFFYFLTPTEPHGLGHTLLEHVLRGLSEHDDLEYRYSRFDLDDVQIKQEVNTSNGIPDALVWVPEEWFICWELKIYASETDEQTEKYVELDSFGGIDLEKDEVPSDGHHYIYRAPESASCPSADEFVHVTWEWVADQLQSFLGESYAEHPLRTTAQLTGFLDTIRSELTMTEYQENRQEIIKLYLEHYDTVTELTNTFDEEWERFAQTWGTRLGNTLENAEIVEDSDLPDEYEAVDITTEEGEQRRWTFRQGKDDWSWLFPREWWRKLDEDSSGRPVPDAHKPNGRVGFLHRLDRHREEAVSDNKLILYVRNAPSGHDDFYNNFARRFNASGAVGEAIEGTQFQKTGNKSNVLRAEYTINVDAFEDFFDAYVDALVRGMREGVIANQPLVDVINDCYEETITVDIDL